MRPGSSASDERGLARLDRRRTMACRRRPSPPGRGYCASARAKTAPGPFHFPDVSPTRPDPEARSGCDVPPHDRRDIRHRLAECRRWARHRAARGHGQIRRRGAATPRPSTPNRSLPRNEVTRRHSPLTTTPSNAGAALAAATAASAPGQVVGAQSVAATTVRSVGHVDHRRRARRTPLRRDSAARQLKCGTAPRRASDRCDRLGTASVSPRLPRPSGSGRQVGTDPGARRATGSLGRTV